MAIVKANKKIFWEGESLTLKHVPFASTNTRFCNFLLKLNVKH